MRLGTPNFFLVVCCLSLAACRAGSPEGPATQTVTEVASKVEVRADTPIQQKGDVKDDLGVFATGGANILASETGDLTGDGRSDAVLVLDPPASGSAPGELEYRTVALLIRDDQGQLQKVSQNDKLIPCATCGGAAGDPFGYARIKNGELTLVTEGGSRERWSSEYVFKYVAAQNDLVLEKVDRSAFDQISQQSVSRTFTQKDFGNVAFSKFNPSIVPEVVIP